MCSVFIWSKKMYKWHSEFGTRLNKGFIFKCVQILWWIFEVIHTHTHQNALVRMERFQSLNKQLLKLSNESQWTNKQTQTLCSLSLTIFMDLLIIMAYTKTHSLWKNRRIKVRWTEGIKNTYRNNKMGIFLWWTGHMYW